MECLTRHSSHDLGAKGRQHIVTAQSVRAALHISSRNSVSSVQITSGGLYVFGVTFRLYLGQEEATALWQGQKCGVSRAQDGVTEWDG